MAFAVASGARQEQGLYTAIVAALMTSLFGGTRQQILGPAFTIALLGAIESLLSAVVSDGMAGTQHDSNQELIGQGIANTAAPLFGGFAATGAIARTATNIRSLNLTLGGHHPNSRPS